MSDHARARLGAPQRAVNHLSDLADAVTGRLDSVGRSGTIVALSAGLVAAVTLPGKALADGPSTAAPAVATASHVGAAAPRAAAVPLQVRGAVPPGLAGNPLAAPGMLSGGATLTAPATAKVAFESGSFVALPKPPPVVVPPRAVVPAPAHRAERRTTARTASPASGTVERSSAVKPASRSTSKATTKSAGKSSSKSAGKSSSKSAGKSSKSAKSSRESVGGSSVLAIAARYVGTPYRYGGTTPSGFDCSGFTRYVYKQLGYSLPRTANQQLGATRRVSRSAARAGDLVFFVRGGRAYHIGIYAGNGKMYDSPRSGKTLQKRAIWDAAVVFGRVTR